MKVFTIGFTQKTAKQFFETLRQPGLVRLVDVRLNNVSQLAGFTKRADLKYFLKRICGVDYVHMKDLAPTQEILNEFKKDGGDWSVYERKFLDLMAQRRIEETISKDIIEGGCLLCSEPTPEHCHRRLVIEYLSGKWGGMEVLHL